MLFGRLLQRCFKLNNHTELLNKFTRTLFGSFFVRSGVLLIQQKKVVGLENIMNFYFKKENVENYQKMMQGYDNRQVLAMVKKYLPAQSSLLEIGSGTGADLVQLAEDYQVTGSDHSPLFVEAFKMQYPAIKMIQLDARTLKITETFDCIYSNKVLYHLPKSDFIKSLSKQAALLNEEGIIFMTLWYGEYREEQIPEEGLIFSYYTKTDIKKIIPESLEIKEMERYTEDAAADSLVIVLKKKKKNE